MGGRGGPWRRMIDAEGPDARRVPKERRGQTVRVQFRGTTDVSLPTSFRIDDVSLR